MNLKSFTKENFILFLNQIISFQSRCFINKSPSTFKYFNQHIFFIEKSLKIKILCTSYTNLKFSSMNT